LFQIDLTDPALIASRLKKPLEFFQIKVNEGSSHLLSDVERLVLSLAYDVFMRADEIAGLKWQDIIIDSPYPGLNVLGKGAKRRFISTVKFPLIGELFVRMRIDKQTYAISEADGLPYSRDGIASICKTALRKLGLPTKNPHFLRHLGITKEILSGTPLAEVSAMAGHAHVSTTVHEYFHGQLLLTHSILKGKPFLFELLDYKSTMLSLKEAARLSGRGLRTLQYWCTSGKINASKIKGEWVIAEADLFLMTKPKKQK
jgi:hypothetical protein